MGELALLNVGTGDTKIHFDPEDPEGTKIAGEMVRDMIRKGYAVLVEVGKDDRDRPLYRRAKEFDVETTEYIVAGLPPEIDDNTSQDPKEDKPRVAKRTTGRRGRRAATERVPAKGRKAVAVAPTAGG